MTLKRPGLEGRLQLSGILAVAGLIVEWISLLWNRPLAFLLFIFVGGALMGAGILLYLYSLVTKTREVPNE